MSDSAGITTTTEPSDAQVDAAARAMFEHDTSEIDGAPTWEAYTTIYGRQSKFLQIARLALVAARSVSHHADHHLAPDSEAETCWRDFWAPIVAPDGVVDLEQVKLELHDFHGMIEEVPKAYGGVTGGRISKPNTMAHEVIAQVEERIAEDLEEQLGGLKKFVISAIKSTAKDSWIVGIDDLIESIEAWEL